MDGGATRVSVLHTTVPFRRVVSLSVVVKIDLCFWCFFLFRLVETLVGFVVCHWMLASGCLVFVGLRLFDLFSLLVMMEVMFARNIGGDGSLTMVVMDHI